MPDELNKAVAGCLIEQDGFEPCLPNVAELDEMPEDEAETLCPACKEVWVAVRLARLCAQPRTTE